MSAHPLCPYCLRSHHAVDLCEPAALLVPWTGADPARQRRADLLEAEVIRVYRALRPR